MVSIKKYHANIALEGERSERALGRPFFIVGAGRSGSTLLRLLLAGHPNLHVCPETWFIQDLAGRLPLQGPLTPAELELAIDLVAGHYRWPDLNLASSDLRAAVGDLERPTLRAFLDALYGCLADRAGKRRVGDKTPVYVRILPVLAELYPDAQFIHLLRDGRDVAISYIDNQWSYRCYQGARFEWTAAVRAARRFARTVPADRWFELRYEDLVTQPETAVRRLCAYLGEAFEPAMMAFADRVALVPERERSIHPGLTRAIAAGAAGRWRYRLSRLEAFVMEACLHRDLVENGYGLRYAGPLWQPLLAAAGGVLKAAAPVLLVVLPALKRRRLIGARSCL